MVDGLRQAETLSLKDLKSYLKAVAILIILVIALKLKMLKQQLLPRADS